MTTEGKWHFIPMRFIQRDPKGDAGSIPLYWRHLHDGEYTVAFMPVTKDDITAVVKYLNLRLSTVKWKIVGNEVNCIAAMAVPPKKLTKKELAEQYVALRGNIENEKANAKSSMEGAAENARIYLQKLTESYRQFHMHEDKLAELEEGGDKAYVKELKNILGLPLVDSVSIQDGQLLVKTKPLHARDGTIYGSMTIYIDPITGYIHKIMNENPRRSSTDGTIQHPYVHNGVGEICWGNSGGVIADLGAKKDILGLVVTTIDFLESYNPEEQTGRGLTRLQAMFKEKNPEKAEVKENREDAA